MKKFKQFTKWPYAGPCPGLSPPAPPPGRPPLASPSLPGTTPSASPPLTSRSSTKLLTTRWWTQRYDTIRYTDKQTRALFVPIPNVVMYVVFNCRLLHWHSLLWSPCNTAIKYTCICKLILCFIFPGSVYDTLREKSVFSMPTCIQKSKHCFPIQIRHMSLDLM